jgi:hypothetical protein
VSSRRRKKLRPQRRSRKTDWFLQAKRERPHSRFFGYQW